MDNAASVQTADILAIRNNQLRELATKNNQWELYCTQLKQDLDKSQAENKTLRNQITEWEQRFNESQRRLADSERSRLALEEDMTNFRKSYETEITLLKTQAEIYKEDFTGLKHELDEAQCELSTVRMDLSVARSLVSRVESASQMSMEDIHRRREESLARYRRDYERQHPGYQPPQRGVYQTDSLDINLSEGEDEID